MSENHPDVSLPVEQPEGGAGSFARAHRILLIFLAAVVVVWLLTGFYSVRSDQVAIIERLGQFVTNKEGKVHRVEHGLHYHLPWPIDRVHIVSTQQAFTMKVDQFNTMPAEYGNLRQSLLREGASPLVVDSLFNPYLITSDKSVAHIEISVTFQINDPEAWLTSISHDYLTTYEDTAHGDIRNALFQQLAQRVIVHEVAKRNLDVVLREGREELQRAIEDSLKASMTLHDPSRPAEEIKLGVQVTKAVISVSRVPDRVRPAYENLIGQRARRDTAVQTATADYNALVTRAKGEQNTLILDAQTYKEKVTQMAKGESDRFREVLAQYRASPEQMRFNLWVDALRLVVANTRRTLFPSRGDVNLIIDPPQFDAGQQRPGQ